MAANIFKGLGIALVTPFHANGSIDFEALDRLIDYQLENDTDFFCILGTTAETPCLTADERQQVKEFCVKKIAGRVPILMGCGSNNTRALVSNEYTTAAFAPFVHTKRLSPSAGLAAKAAVLIKHM